MWQGKHHGSAGTDVELAAFIHNDALGSGPTPSFASDLVSKNDPSSTRHNDTRWKTGAGGCAAAAGSVFIFNLIFLLWGEGRDGFQDFNYDDGARTLYQGNCDTTKNINIGIHLLINILSTVLLGASNYCMQCMSAPTRHEVDKAHTKFKWVDIGIPSLRNLGRIRGTRLVLWLILGLSSLPLHLFYNSTVYASIAANEYFVYSVNEAFFDISASNFSYVGTDPLDIKTVANDMFQRAKNGQLLRLSQQDCLDKYAQNFQTSHGSLLLVVSNSTPGFVNGPTLDFEAKEQPIMEPGEACASPFTWICNAKYEPSSWCRESCNEYLPQFQTNPDKWDPFGKGIEYCMSEKIEQRCRLKYSVHLVVVVVVIGFLKAAAMLYIALWVHDTPIMTIGDAVSSFLAAPDPATKGMCLLSKSDFTKLGNSTASGYRGTGWNAPPQAFKKNRARHFSAASYKRLFAFFLIFTVLLLATIILLIYGINELNVQSDAFKLGLGAVDARTFISWRIPTTGTMGLIANVVVANVPQLLLSFLYLNYNGLMTVMSLAREWSRYAVRRQGLRVSTNRRGAQRSTYFLQLPYRFSLPIVVATGALHWLISQSIFLVSVEEYTISRYGSDMVAGDTLMTCGYSPRAILATILLSALLLVVIVVVGLGRLPSEMPVAGSCSAAIAAACHAMPGTTQEDESAAELQWGAMGEDGKGVGHCGFSMHEVWPLQMGKLYA